MLKRVFQVVVLFFAIYAFVFVPLGRKTALEHVRAIAGTSAAREAATELKGGVTRLAHELREQAQRSTEATDEQIAGTDAAVPGDEPEPQRPRAKASPSRPKAIESGASNKRKGPQRIPSRDPAAAANEIDPSQLSHPPDLKELRELGLEQY